MTVVVDRTVEVVGGTGCTVVTGGTGLGGTGFPGGNGPGGMGCPGGTGLGGAGCPGGKGPATVRNECVEIKLQKFISLNIFY